MPDRRRSSVTSYKSAIGYGCVRLLLVSTITVLCVTKVVLGGEFISACPLEPSLPVYVVISGCLPVFLCPLSKSPAAGDNRYVDRFSKFSKYTKVLLLFGIVSNGAWLILGTFLLARILILQDPSKLHCDSSNVLSDAYSTNLMVLLNETTSTTTMPSVKPSNTVPIGTFNKGPYLYMTSTIASTTEISNLKKVIFPTTAETVNKDGESKDSKLSREHNSPVPLNGHSILPRVKYESVANESNVDIDDKITLDKVLKSTTSDQGDIDKETHIDVQTTSQPGVIYKSSDESNTITSEPLQATNSVPANITRYGISTNVRSDSKCGHCAVVLVRFSFATITIDWTFALGGSVFMLARMCLGIQFVREMVPFL